MSTSNDSCGCGSVNCGSNADAEAQGERVPVPRSGLAQSRKSRARAWVLKRIGPAGFTFGFAPMLCNPPPGPCLGLQIGDHLVMTIEQTRDFVDTKCDFEGLGLTAGKQVRFRVDEQTESGNGENVYCSVSTGTVEADTGWNYQAPAMPSQTYESDDFVTAVEASSGDCIGDLSFLLDVEGVDDLTEPRPGRIRVAYRATNNGPDCMVSCPEGTLMGPVVRIRS
jgi:hypothetical protein